jgi:hypothetical protein
MDSELHAGPMVQMILARRPGEPGAEVSALRSDLREAMPGLLCFNSSSSMKMKMKSD